MSSAAAPGALMPLYDGGYGIVLESSRHKAIVTTAEADTELIAIFQAEQRDPPHLETWTFYSHHGHRQDLEDVLPADRRIKVLSCPTP